MSRQILGQTPCTFGSPRSVAFQNALGNVASMIGENNRINNLNQQSQIMNTTNISYLTPDKFNYGVGIGFVEKKTFVEGIGFISSIPKPK